MPVYTQSESAFWPLADETPESFARRVLEPPLAELFPKGGEISVLFADDPRIQELNREYRAIDRPTDVLAFQIEEEAPTPDVEPILGDIVVSVETAMRQAAEREVGAADELALLLLHGLLHLLGRDHQDSRGEADMRELQDKWLDRLGFAAGGWDRE